MSHRHRKSALALFAFLAACGPTSPDLTAGAQCATSDGTQSSCSPCPQAEACLTDQVCGPPAEGFNGGTLVCGQKNPTLTGDHCRRRCQAGSCPAGEQCYRFKVWSCSDVQQTLEVCCTAGSNCGR